MTNEKQERGLTRRSFLKASGVAAGAAVAAGSLSACAGSNLSPISAQEFQAGQPANEGEQIFRGVCRPNCFGFCHLNVHVKDGRVVKTSRAPYLNEDYNRICHRGLSHVQRIYDPARIQYPMRRAEGSARGEGKWERVSWDEAIAEIGSKMADYRETYGNQSVALLIGSQVDSAMYAWMRLLQGTSMTTVLPHYDMASAYAQGRIVGGNNWESNERADLVNAKTIVCWGDNVTDAQVQTFHFYKEAMMQGTKLVVIDPKFTVMASKADKWVAIRPGTDTALLMAVMDQIFKRDALDRDFLRNHTVAPFLVRSDTGTFLRLTDIDPVAAAEKAARDEMGQQIFAQIFAQYLQYGQAIAYGAAMQAQAAVAYQDQYIVISDGKPVPLAQAEKADLFGTYTGEGYTCKTALQLLKERVAEMPIERAAEICDLTPATINELTDIFLDGPVSHCVGYGSQAYTNGVHTTHAGYTMCGLIGNIGKPGACWGACWTGVNIDTNYIIGAGIGTSASMDLLDFPAVMASGEWMANPYPIKMAINVCGNPLCCNPNTNGMKAAFDALDFVVCVDSVLTDTARYSDLVLPCAQYFEHEDYGGGGETMRVSYNEKAIDPLYESKSDVEIVHLVAEQLGMGEPFTPDPAVAVQQMLGDVVDFQKLKGYKEVRLFGDYPHIAFRGGNFDTPTGRMEFYVEAPAVRETTLNFPTPEDIDREHLPQWFPPTEAWAESEAMQNYPFHCMSERPRYRVHSQWHSVPALRELDPEPIVKMNPADAAERNLEIGAYVECFNDLGHVVAKLVLSEAVRPGTLVYPKGWQAFQHKAGSWSELLSDRYDKFGVGGVFMDMCCDIREWKEGAN